MFVSEANMRDNIPPEQKSFHGYYVITPNTSYSMGYSRIILLVREGVKLDILDNCMDETVPAIWVKVISRGRKPIIIGGLYREFHLLLQNQHPNNTDDIKLQLERWKTTVNGWKKAARNSKCIVFGDININYNKWDQDDYRLKKFAQVVKDQIETEGFIQLLDKCTRFWPGKPPSLVDHIWTNSPNNIMTTANKVRAFSDHNCISAVIRTKDRPEQEHEIERRDRRKMDVSRYVRRISEIDWKDLYLSRDINTINNIFETKVGQILEEEAPLKWFQTRRNHKGWLSADLKDMMKDRDLSREQARTTGQADHWQFINTREIIVLRSWRNKGQNITKIYLKHLKKVMTPEIFTTLPGNC